MFPTLCWVGKDSSAIICIKRLDSHKSDPSLCPIPRASQTLMKPNAAGRALWAVRWEAVVMPPGSSYLCDLRQVSELHQDLVHLPLLS